MSVTRNGGLVNRPPPRNCSRHLYSVFSDTPYRRAKAAAGSSRRRRIRTPSCRWLALNFDGLALVRLLRLKPNENHTARSLTHGDSREPELYNVQRRRILAALLGANKHGHFRVDTTNLHDPDPLSIEKQVLFYKYPPYWGAIFSSQKPQGARKSLFDKGNDIHDLIQVSKMGLRQLPTRWVVTIKVFRVVAETSSVPRAVVERLWGQATKHGCTRSYPTGMAVRRFPGRIRGLPDADSTETKDTIDRGI